MPVYFEDAVEFSAQDLTDLEKIYADAPDWLLPPYADAATLIQQGIQQQNLVVARFNSRLLGAALLNKHAKVWTLSHLCVRALTRRRGVARRLVDEAKRLAQEAQATLQIAIPSAQTEMIQLAQRKSLKVINTD